MLKNSVPGNCVMAASQLRSCGSQALNRIGARVYCESASTSVIAGVWACRSWANDAAVKEDRANEVGDAVGGRSDCVQVRRHDPSTNNAEPMMNSQAIAAFRRTGLTAMALPSRNQRGAAPVRLHLYRNGAVGASPAKDESRGLR